MSRVRLNKQIVFAIVASSITIPLFWVVYTMLQFNDQHRALFFLREYPTRVLLAFLIIFFVAISDIYVINKVNLVKTFQKKLFLGIFIKVLITSISATIINRIFFELFYFTQSNLQFLEGAQYALLDVFLTIVLNMIFVAGIEASFFFRKWRDSVIHNANLLVEAERMKAEQEKIKREKEILEKENMLSELELLKNHLNPHFLFNSLNVLSSLINQNKEKAVTFVEVFADVYRYVLDIGNEPIVLLKNEIDFIKSFVYLQKIRFGNSLSVEIDIDKSLLSLFIPPLSLQELVQNAIKHNEVSAEYPLKIKLFNEGNYLVVTNNLNSLGESSFSNKTGQTNIIKRYALLSSEIPNFKKLDKEYIARIPLIKAEEYHESTDS